jgi:hypothetical protein
MTDREDVKWIPDTISHVKHMKDLNDKIDIFYSMYNYSDNTKVKKGEMMNENNNNLRMELYLKFINQKIEEQNIDQENVEKIIKILNIINKNESFLADPFVKTASILTRDINNIINSKTIKYKNIYNVDNYIKTYNEFIIRSTFDTMIIQGGYVSKIGDDMLNKFVDKYKFIIHQKWSVINKASDVIFIDDKSDVDFNEKTGKITMEKKETQPQKVEPEIILENNIKRTDLNQYWWDRIDIKKYKIKDKFISETINRELEYIWNRYKNNTNPWIPEEFINNKRKEMETKILDPYNYWINELPKKLKIENTDENIQFFKDNFTIIYKHSINHNYTLDVKKMTDGWTALGFSIEFEKFLDDKKKKRLESKKEIVYRGIEDIEEKDTPDIGNISYYDKFKSLQFNYSDNDYEIVWLDIASSMGINTTQNYNDIIKLSEKNPYNNITIDKIKSVLETNYKSEKKSYEKNENVYLQRQSTEPQRERQFEEFKSTSSTVRNTWDKVINGTTNRYYDPKSKRPNNNNNN